MRYYVKRKFLLLATLLLTGCVDWVEDKDDLVQFVNKSKATPSGSVPPLPEYEPYKSFVYEGASLREPFVALIPYIEPIDSESLNPQDEFEGLQPDLERPKEYLESFAIDDLKMVGSVSKKENDSLWALIEDSNGEVHRIGNGAFMGLDFGLVTQIDEEKVVLSEIVTNGRGGWMKRSRNLALSEQE